MTFLNDKVEKVKIRRRNYWGYFKSVKLKEKEIEANNKKEGSNPRRSRTAIEDCDLGKSGQKMSKGNNRRCEMIR